MRKVVLLLVILALSSPVVASAAGAASTTGKNVCLLNSENCPDAKPETIQETIAKLEKEVGKGSEVYSREELSILQTKLSEYQQMLDNLTMN